MPDEPSDSSKFSRRQFGKGTIGLGALGIAGLPRSGTLMTVFPGAEKDFTPLGADAVLVEVITQDGAVRLHKTGEGRWTGPSLEVKLTPASSGAKASLTAGTGVKQVHIRWRRDLKSGQRVLNDHWERAYGDLQWGSINPSAALPWYFGLITDQGTIGAGVKTGPNALCFWTVDADGISLWADVRSGGVPVQLGARTLEMCEIVSLKEGKASRSRDVIRHLCQMMCPHPRLPKGPIFGFNDWDYDYGTIDPDEFISISGLMAELSPSGFKPHAVVDAGWSSGGTDSRPYTSGSQKFGDMHEFAAKVERVGAIPGLWYRPLITGPKVPESLLMKHNKSALDPTLEGTREIIRNDLKGFVEWGVQLVKHDFSTWDMFGKWGFQMGSQITNDGWSFSRTDLTNAEISLDLYRLLREGLPDVLIMGCNTWSHLSAGIFEINRVGDDTSGRTWNRTRRMGVNAIAMRGVQNDAFYRCDPDMAAITPEQPLEYAEKFMRLIAESGHALFVSPDPKVADAKVKAAIKKSFETVCHAPAFGLEPMDWEHTVSPAVWKSKTVSFEEDWFGPGGAWPYND